MGFNIFNFFIIMLGVAMFFMSSTKMLMEQQVDIGRIISNFLVSAAIIGTGLFMSDLILKELNSNDQSTVAEQKAEKEKELSGEEKMKKLNAYRRNNNKNILLPDASVTDQYLNYLKSKNLDKAALN